MVYIFLSSFFCIHYNQTYKRISKLEHGSYLLTFQLKANLFNYAFLCYIHFFPSIVSSLFAFLKDAQIYTLRGGEQGREREQVVENNIDLNT